MHVESYGNSGVLDLVDAAGQPLALPAWWMRGVTFHVGMCLGYQANAKLPLKITTKAISDGNVARGTLITTLTPTPAPTPAPAPAPAPALTLTVGGGALGGA